MNSLRRPNVFQDFLPEMDPVWTTTVLLVPFVVVLTAGFFYLYGAVISLFSKTSVRNKVVVITDALSGLGRGNTCSDTRLCRVSHCSSDVTVHLCCCRMCRCVSQRWSEADPLWEELGEAGRVR